MEQVRSGRLYLLAGFDGFVWVASMTGFALLSGAHLGGRFWAMGMLLGVAAAGVHLGLGRIVRLHHGRAALGSLEEMILLGLVTASAGLVIMPLTVATRSGVPVMVPIAATFMSLVVMAWARATWRTIREPDWRDIDLPDRVRAVVIGAGDGGRQLVGSMLRDSASRWVPVALLDDDPLKTHLRVRGVPVLGTSKQLVEIAYRVGASAAIVAIPSVSARRMRELSELALKAGLELKVLPATNDLLSDNVDVSDVRDINVTDLLGRRQIETDLASVAGYLSGKRVLVTGAGGSIGSELCRQVAQFEPSELIMLDRDESALHAVQLSIYGRAMLDSDDVVLGDIRDTQFLYNLFRTRKPDVVFHAAALKHLPMLEQYPGEAIKTNVWGTLSVLEAAKAAGVEKFVNISTDKAANPISVLGYSKRLGEAMTAAMAAEADGSYLSVRFGNVLGSRGSVLTSFTAQIAAGGPVTVTDPEVTRYFMTVQEAVQLVIQAAAIGHDGEVLVLDMGEPVHIDSVARQLIELSGKPIDVVYTGLRVGEKLHEQLLADGERDVRRVHPLVAHISVPPLDPLVARTLDPWAPNTEVIETLKRLCRGLTVNDSQVAS
jgi:FlaA1/EpsC-like NDP-sugar epimerase